MFQPVAGHARAWRGSTPGKRGLGTETSAAIVMGGRPDPTHRVVLQPAREGLYRHESQPADVNHRNVRENVLAEEVVAHAQQFRGSLRSDRELLDLDDPNLGCRSSGGGVRRDAHWGGRW